MGGTSVTGGGDLVAITVKLEVLEYLRAKYQMYSSFYLNYSEMPFEPNYERAFKGAKFTLATTEAYPGGGAPPVRAKVVKAVVVPGSAWVNGSTKVRASIVSGIAETIARYDATQLARGMLEAEK